MGAHTDLDDVAEINQVHGATTEPHYDFSDETPVRSVYRSATGDPAYVVPPWVNTA